MALGGYFTKKIIDFSIERFSKNINTLTYLETKLRLDLQYVVDQNNSAITYLKIFQLLESLNLYDTKGFLLLSLCKHTFLDTDNRIENAKKIIIKLKKKNKKLVSQSGIDINDSEEHLLTVMGSIYSSIAFYNAYILLFFAKNFLDKKEKELQKIELYRNKEQLISDTKKYIDKYNSIRGRLTSLKLRKAPTINQDESVLRAEFILSKYYEHKSQVDWESAIKGIFSEDLSQQEWKEKITKEWVLLFGAESIKPFWREDYIKPFA